MKFHKFRHSEEWHRGRHQGGERYLRGPEGHHRRHGGRSRLGRFFEHGDLKLVVLQLISEKPRHGYEIIKAIEEKTNGVYTPSPGTVYPTLTLLQEIGQLTVSESTDGRKLYALTEEGAAALAANRKTVDAAFAYVEQAGATRGPAPTLREAFHKLRQALRERLAQGPIDEAQLQAIVAKLNEASDLAAKS
ncbi:MULTISPECIES: PadR family transcriptional regulator [unclassified Beijerinckia]|uniref:PadR family transcriptional regulator n=1 Tax=unclassified Beijerinckia TaxID=2638183 RepID=UPI000899FC14|nr:MULTISPECIES: PadR family transcriptional regulator [unclassified Beijerinckia]MDH7793970.1 DNA-binding PadR family transcriptional regulator [Beijerinckia sp. GAS462]SEB50521.1 DNA-binding transcriptional regulator, PadR family [Beijerinckia sp. 28-YEA-48]